MDTKSRPPSVPQVVATGEMAPVEFERIPADSKRAAETERTSLDVAAFFKVSGGITLKIRGNGPLKLHCLDVFDSVATYTLPEHAPG